MKYDTFLSELTCFDNAGDDAGAGDAGAADAAAAAAEAAAAEAAAAAAAAAGDPKPADKTFNQEDVNKMVGTRNKVLQEKFIALEGNYKELLEQTNLTDAARQKLQGDLEAVQAEMRTKEQQVEFERKKNAEKFESDINAANEERIRWKNLYETSTIERAIKDAAARSDGFNGDDFIAHLGPKAKVVEEVDSVGEKTGRLVPRIEWETKSETGEITIVMKSPQDVIDMMKETPLYGNLFKSNVAKGVGEGTAPGQVSPVGKIAQDRISTEDFMKMRNDPEARKRMGLSR